VHPAPDNLYFATFMNKLPGCFTKNTAVSIALIMAPLLLHAQPFKQYSSYLKRNNQLVLVQATNWNTTQGTLQLYSRKNRHHSWKLNNQFAVTLGRNGLASDRRSVLAGLPTSTIKKEGDGKSPAGLFGLGPVFSYHQLQNLKMPFKTISSGDICVDDVRSSHYNTWVNTDTASHKDWNSFEQMKQDDDSYEYGVWVKYNSATIAAGDGSCIFLHVWGGNAIPTAGCTAMDKQNMIALIYWLDHTKRPVLLQLVVSPFENVK
jgi:L,D-peptidoglycan transpeptidase YkuD (ErfK/YbiS/YcfS/YnhG family)